jgi:hypothetical protein
MPAHRIWKRRVDVKAPPAAWERLGAMLEVRRRTLGHTYRTTFERERRVNRRLAADIEKAAKDRINTFTNGSLGLIAQGYAVDYESVLAVLRGEADELVPVPVVPVDPDLAVPPAPPGPVPAVPAEPPGWTPPASGTAFTAEARRNADRIWVRLRDLAAAGVADPDGARLFGPGTADAKTWDGAAASLDLPDLVWLIADLQCRAAARARNPAAAGTGTNGQ